MPTIRTYIRCTLAACLLGTSLQAGAVPALARQDSVVPSRDRETSRFWNTALGKALRWGDRLLMQWEHAGLDTAYVRVPQRDRMVYLGAYTYWQQYDLGTPLVELSTHAYQTELELGIDWRGLAIELPIPIRNRFSHSYGLAKTGSTWGARARYKTSDHLLDTKTFYFEAYYVLNHKRFCLAAPLYGDMIQRRSAGGFFLMAQYHQGRLGATDLLPHHRETLRNNKLSIGAGYGYNLAFLDGRLSFHASLIPMLSPLNSITHKVYDDTPTTDAATTTPGTLSPTDAPTYTPGTLSPTPDAPTSTPGIYTRHSGLTLNAFARLAATYSMTDRWLLNFFLNYRTLLFSNSEGLRIKNRDAAFQLNLGYRF